MARPRHTNQDLEAILRSAERQGWRVEKGKGYFKMWCPCADKHWTTVHLTPSDRRYALNLRKKLLRSTCWKE